MALLPDINLLGNIFLITNKENLWQVAPIGYMQALEFYSGNCCSYDWKNSNLLFKVLIYYLKFIVTELMRMSASLLENGEFKGF